MSKESQAGPTSNIIKFPEQNNTAQLPVKKSVIGKVADVLIHAAKVSAEISKRTPPFIITHPFHESGGDAQMMHNERVDIGGDIVDFKTKKPLI